MIDFHKFIYKKEMTRITNAKANEKNNDNLILKANE